MKPDFFAILQTYSPFLILGIAIFLRLIENKLFPKPDTIRVIGVPATQKNTRTGNNYLMYKIGVRFLLFIGIISNILFLSFLYSDDDTFSIASEIIAIVGGGIVGTFFIGIPLLLLLPSLIAKKQIKIIKDILSGKRKESYMFTLSDPTNDPHAWNHYRDYIHYPVIFVLFGIVFLLSIWKGQDGLILGASLFYPCLLADYSLITWAKHQLVKEAFPEKEKYLKLDIQWRIAFIELANQYHFPVRKITQQEWADFYFSMKRGKHGIPGTHLLTILYRDNPEFLEDFKKILAYAEMMCKKVQQEENNQEKTIELNPFYNPSDDSTSQRKAYQKSYFSKFDHQERSKRP